MDIIVSSPGSPGTSFTDNVKDKIVTIFDVLASSDDFVSLRDLGSHLESCGLNWNYTRNILPFLQNCGIVNYQNAVKFENKKFFTNIGYVYIDILKSIQIVKNEPQSVERDDLLKSLDAIQEAIYFQCLVFMMRNRECNYSRDFYDVLFFVDKYHSIDATEYLLIQHFRKLDVELYLNKMADVVWQYRDGSIVVNVKTKTKNDDSGAAKSVNSFPYVQGSFQKAGVFLKDDDGRSYINEARRSEVDAAIREVAKVWQN